ATVVIWDRASGKWTRTATLTGHTGAVKSVAIADRHTASSMAVVIGNVRTDPASAVAIAPDGTWLATAGEATVVIWDRASGKWTRTATLTGHTGAVKSVAIAPDGTWLATAGEATVVIWDRTSEQALTMTRTAGQLSACAWTSDGSGLIVGGGSGAYFYEFRPGTPDV
ncbi:WD40 repeat domain-containing protein, partial [Streptomyces sp. NPDC004752]